MPIVRAPYEEMTSGIGLPISQGESHLEQAKAKAGILKQRDLSSSYLIRFFSSPTTSIIAHQSFNLKKYLTMSSMLLRSVRNARTLARPSSSKYAVANVIPHRYSR